MKNIIITLAILQLSVLTAAQSCDEVINGCTYSRATDNAGVSAVTIGFWSYRYTPSCMVVDPGTNVSFVGDFAKHPLVPGYIDAKDQSKYPSQRSPLPAASEGGARSVVLNDAGVYPYYCEAHGVPYNMYGVIYVDHRHCNEAGNALKDPMALWTVILVVFLFLL